MQRLVQKMVIVCKNVAKIMLKEASIKAPYKYTSEND